MYIAAQNRKHLRKQRCAVTLQCPEDVSAGRSVSMPMVRKHLCEPELYHLETQGMVLYPNILEEPRLELDCLNSHNISRSQEAIFAVKAANAD